LWRIGTEGTATIYFVSVVFSFELRHIDGKSISAAFKNEFGVKK
jgi:hypothetical protein